MIIGTVSDDLFCRTSLGAYTWYQEEVVRTEAAEFLELVSLGCTYDEHHVVRCGNLHHLFHYRLIERLSIFLSILELVCRSI